MEARSLYRSRLCPGAEEEEPDQNPPFSKGGWGGFLVFLPSAIDENGKSVITGTR